MAEDSGDETGFGGDGGWQAQLAADAFGEAVWSQQLAHRSPIVALSDMVASALNPAEADLAARTERPKRELGPQPLGMERHLSRDRGAGLVGSNVAPAGTEPQRSGDNLQRGAALSVKTTTRDQATEGKGV